MISLSRDSWLAIGLFITLILITIAAALQQTQVETAPALTSFSAAPDGAKALWLWLDQLDYPVSQEIAATFEIPDDTDLILLLEPSSEITHPEWQLLDAWVKAGGTLILAGDGLFTALAVPHYQFNLAYFNPPTSTLTIQTPLWRSPPLTPATVQPRAYFETMRADFVVHLAIEDKPIILSFEQEAGRVILSAAPFPFSNAGLKEVNNPALVLNLISAADHAGTIWFDEWHHGLRPDHAEIIGPTGWLRYTPAGHSILYVVAIIFIVIALRGRHFGRPVPLLQDMSRRAPLEYITAIANLNRRARHRSAVLHQYHHWLKRGLGQRYRLNPTLPDEEYITQLAQFNPGLDVPALRNLLTRLNQKRVSESELTLLAREVADWLKER